MEKQLKEIAKELKKIRKCLEDKTSIEEEKMTIEDLEKLVRCDHGKHSPLQKRWPIL